MKQGWELKKLGEVCDVIGGGTPSKAISKFYGGNIFWATVRDMKDDIVSNTEHKITSDAVKNSSTNIIPKGNVIIATRVGLGKVCLLENDTAINQDLRGIVPKKKSVLLVAYLYHWLKSISQFIVEEGTGATVQGVKLPFIKGLAIPLPPLTEQQHIVSILEKAFFNIATAKANAEQNLKNAKELFESYLQRVFTSRVEGWEERELRELGVITSSKRIYKSEYVSEGVPFYRTKEIKEMAHGKDITLELFISSERYYEIKKDFGVPQIGDLLMSAVGTIGEIMVISDENEFYFKDGNIVWYKEFRSLDTNYLKYALTAFVEKIKSLAIGSSYNALTIEKLNRYKISYPKSLKEQQKIVQKLDALSTETKKLEAIYQQKIVDLVELKRSILQKAFNG